MLFVYRGDGRYTHCTLILHGGTEISGAISNDALRALEAQLANDVSRRRRGQDPAHLGGLL